MFAIPGIIALVIFIYARPQEFFEHLRIVPFLYVCFLLAVCGGALDLGVGNVKLRATPQLRFIALFFAWCCFTILIRAPTAAGPPVMGLLICIALYALLAHGVQSFRAVHAVAGAVLAMVLLVCGVGAHQGFAPQGCVVLDDTTPGDTSAAKPDGRPCDTIRS